ncbi:hypothetical protein QUF80_04750 [Desulfococcaceae bacterium HSG8]|nr:hypothetical protein [Desulfococcaceae bacterium HSG8]
MSNPNPIAGLVSPASIIVIEALLCSVRIGKSESHSGTCQFPRT